MEMNSDKTAVFQKIIHNKVLDIVLKLATPFLVAIVTGLVWWLNNTTERIVNLEAVAKQETAQWETMKKNADETTNIQIRVGVLEWLNGVGVPMTQHREPGPEPRFDLNKMVEEIENEYNNMRSKDVDEWTNRQQKR